MRCGVAHDCRPRRLLAPPRVQVQVPVLVPGLALGPMRRETPSLETKFRTPRRQTMR